MTEPRKTKYSASAMSTYLESPKKYYWRYVHNERGVELEERSAQRFDHDLVAGSVWSEFVDNFYCGVEEEANTRTMLKRFEDEVHEWCPATHQTRLKDALTNLAEHYYRQFSPDDGVRKPLMGTELWVEDDTFIGRLDGLSPDNIIHEVKLTSRGLSLTDQLWKVQHSLQIKLYACLTDAPGAVVEFGWKDKPHQVYRTPYVSFTKDQKAEWYAEFQALAAQIDSARASGHFPCHPDGCCIVTARFASMCPYQHLCDGQQPVPGSGYKPRTKSS